MGFFFIYSCEMNCFDIPDCYFHIIILHINMKKQAKELHLNYYNEYPLLDRESNTSKNLDIMKNWSCYGTRSSTQSSKWWCETTYRFYG